MAEITQPLSRRQERQPALETRARRGLPAARVADAGLFLWIEMEHGAAHAAVAKRHDHTPHGSNGRKKDQSRTFAKNVRSDIFSECAARHRPRRRKNKNPSDCNRRGFGALAAEAASAAAIHRPGVGFTPTVPAEDITARSRGKGDRIGRAALGTSDIIARTIVLPSAASASLILEGHEIEQIA